MDRRLEPQGLSLPGSSLLSFSPFPRGAHGLPRGGVLPTACWTYPQDFAFLPRSRSASRVCCDNWPCIMAFHCRLIHGRTTMLRQFLTASLLTLSLTQEANAFLSTADALSWLDKGGQQASASRMYLSGMAEAYWVGSMAARSTGGKALICFPKRQDLQTEELQLMAVLSLKKALNTFDSNVDKEGKASFLKNPVSLSLQLAWQTEFPCG